MKIHSRFVNSLSVLDASIYKVFRALMWKNVFVYAAALFLFYFLAYSTLFDLVLRKDAFYYTYKGMEIAHGDLSLFRPQAIGWPLFLSFFYRLMDADNIFEAMFISRWVSIVLICLSVFPIHALCKKMCGDSRYEGASILAVTAYILSCHIQSIARVAYAEPLFILLTLWCYYFLVNKHETGTREIVLSALLAGLSYWVRANGLFQLFVILALIGLWSGGDVRYLFKRGMLAIVVFFSVAAPQLLMRYNQFGSAFDYGQNSKYFVDNFSQVWDDTVPVPSLVEYLSSHGWHDYYSKFIQHGLFQVAETLPSLFNSSIWLMLLVLSLLFTLFRRQQKMYPLALLYLLTVAAFSLVFHVFGHVRHLIFLIPFIFVSCSVLLTSLSKTRFPVDQLVIFLLLAYTAYLRPDMSLLDKDHINVPELKDTWALWAADNLDGNVAVISGGDLLRLAQHYQRPAKDLVPRSFVLVDEQITRVRIRKYNSLAEALPDFHDKGVRYLITDSLNMYRRPFLRDLDSERWQDVFEHVNYFANGNRGAVMFGVNIYQIHYDKFYYGTGNK